MEEDWGDGRARLWNPPFDMLPLVLKMEDERAQGFVVAQRWRAQPWFARLLRLATRVHVLDLVATAEYLEGQRSLNPGWELIVAEIGLWSSEAPQSAMRS
jgi:hypothetical protein